MKCRQCAAQLPANVSFCPNCGSPVPKETALRNVVPKNNVDRLRALDFERDIARLTADFTGRRWIFDDIESWLRNTQGRFFILTGAPGVGKSALAARLTQVRYDIAAFHFCIAGRSSTIEPPSALRSLAAQLAESFSAYGSALANTIDPIHLSVRVDFRVGEMTGGEIAGVIIQNLRAGDPQTEFDLLLRAPLAELPAPHAPVILLVDSLDEAVTHRSEFNLVTLLAAAGDLPPWIRFVCTTRPERRVLRYFDDVEPHVLAAESQMNRDDLRRYVSGRVAKKGIRARLNAAQIESEALVTRLDALAAGNFLYAKFLLDDIQDGHQPVDDLGGLPKGLYDLYHGFLKRFAVGEWEDRYQPMLAVLAAAQEPITEAQLAIFSGVPPGKTRRQLGVLQQFLDMLEEDGGPKRFWLFHQSFREYLLDETRNLDFWCAPEEGHGKIASACLEGCREQWDTCDAYCRTHAAVHLAEAGMWEALADLIQDPLYLLAADPDRLLGVINTEWSRLPERSVHIYQRACHHIRGESLSEGASYLELAAHQSQEEELVDRIVELNLRRQWSTRWVRWQHLRPHQLLTHHREGRVNQAVVAVGRLSDRPVVVSASNDIRVLDLASGALIGELIDGFGERVRALAVGELEGQPVILSGGADGVRIWALRDGSLIGEPFPGDRSGILALAIGDYEGGPVVVAGCADGTVRKWAMMGRVGTEVPLFGDPQIWSHAADGDTGKVRCVAVLALAGRPVIVSGGDDQIIRVWDLATGRSIGADLTGHLGQVTALASGELDGRMVLVSGALGEGGVRVWDPLAGRQTSTHPAPAEGLGGSSALYALDVGEIEGRPVAVSGSYNKGIQFWKLTDGTPAGQPLYGHEGPVKSVALTELRGRTLVVSGGDDGTVRAWPLTEDRPAARAGAERAATAYSISVDKLDGRPVICAMDEDWNLRILDLGTGRLVGEPLPNPLEYPIHMYAFGLLQGRPVLVIYDQHPPRLGMLDPVARQWIGPSLPVYFGRGGMLGALQLGRLGGRLLVLAGSRKGDLWVGDLLDSAQIASWSGDPFSAIAIGELGGRQLVAVGLHGKDSWIQIRNLTDGAEERRLTTSHEGFISAIGLGELADRPAIVSGGSEGDLRVWSPEGELLSEIQMGARIDNVVVGPESRLVVSTSKGIAVLKYHGADECC